MSDPHDERDLRTSIRELAAVLEQGLEAHPSRRDLQDFVAGDLPAAQRENIEEHLALCRQCARDALDLAESLELPPVRRGELLKEGELAAQWESFRGSVAPGRQNRKVLPIAAVLLLTVLGLTVWRIQEQQKAPQPQADVYMANLFARGQLRSSPEELRIPSWAGSLLLVLDLPPEAEETEYRVEIRTQDGRVVWSHRGVQRQENGLAFQLPRDLLRENRYRVLLTEHQGKLAAEYELRLASESGRAP